MKLRTTAESLATSTSIALVALLMMAASLGKSEKKARKEQGEAAN